MFSCALHTSSDDGVNWQAGKIPFPAGEELPERCYAPDVAFGADGTLYISYVTLKGVANAPNAAWIVSSRDDGLTLSVPHRALGPLAFQVQLAADPARAGQLHLNWLQAETTATLAFADTGNPILSSRSEDGGVTWNDPKQVSAPSRARVLAPSLVAAGGTLYTLYLDVGNDVLDYNGGSEGRGGPPYPGSWSLILARSGDGGDTWRETVVDDQVVPTQRFIPFIPPTPSLAVDTKRDRVFVSFSDGRLGDADVQVWASLDGGDLFSPGVRVNDTRTGDGTEQYLPVLGLAPNGRLDVAYYDRRADPANVMNEVSLQSSSDAASTFGPRLALSDRPFDASIGPGSERGLTDIGSRLALASTDDKALAAWTDTRAGTEASDKQDLARAAVAFTTASPFRRVLPPAGVLVSLAGVVVALLILRRPRAASFGAAGAAEGPGRR